MHKYIARIVCCFHTETESRSIIEINVHSFDCNISPTPYIYFSRSCRCSSIFANLNLLSNDSLSFSLSLSLSLLVSLHRLCLLNMMRLIDIPQSQLHPLNPPPLIFRQKVSILCYLSKQHTHI